MALSSDPCGGSTRSAKRLAEGFKGLLLDPANGVNKKLGTPGDAIHLTPSVSPSQSLVDPIEGSKAGPPPRGRSGGSSFLTLLMWPTRNWERPKKQFT